MLETLANAVEIGLLLVGSYHELATACVRMRARAGVGYRVAVGLVVLAACEGPRSKQLPVETFEQGARVDDSRVSLDWNSCAQYKIHLKKN